MRENTKHQARRRSGETARAMVAAGVTCIVVGLVGGRGVCASAPPPDALMVASDLYRVPDAPMDGRIKAEKVTEVDPPPLPERIILPVTPQHRISSDASRVPMSAALYARARQAVEGGLAFLKTQQASDGTWMKPAEAAPTDQPQQPSPVWLAVTSLALKAFVQADEHALQDASLVKALGAIRAAQKPDGSFDDSSMANYITSSVLMALAAIPSQDVDDSVQDAVRWLQTTQWDQGEGLSARQDWFGGSGYGKHGRPDLSNTQMMLDALYDAGLSPDEPAFQRALAFVSRAQNLKAANSAAWVGNDGGFVYTPANGGESFASEAAGEGRYGELAAQGQPRSLRSYGSMTYAGFKSMLYAGLSPDDVRVRAAFDWVRSHWTFDENPGLGRQGLFYYLHTMARALAASQQHTIADIEGVSHNWRNELVTALLARQGADGSWVNADEERWMEDSKVLVTVYAVLALEEALKAASSAPTAAE